ncbi:hypothetical protein HUT13_13505 [Streptomyces harbinensis]|uniref:hypothetical protein n=1 Tax=Streptomyces harbinensis TaxID=1176198 RepID=UPI00158FD4B4|nr:hypothetical protein [Streptomyces harbinensis]QKV69678.1 hypothetical protein HUT13_13505 [Streptomyces harbinensis]
MERNLALLMAAVGVYFVLIVVFRIWHDRRAEERAARARKYTKNLRARRRYTIGGDPGAGSGGDFSAGGGC